MIKTDRSLAKSILKLTHHYADEIWYNPDQNEIQIVRTAKEPLRSVPLRISPEEFPEALQRLSEKKMVRLHDDIGGVYFSLTSYLLHRWAFFWDRFTKKFWGGFVVGILSGIIGTVVGGSLQAYIHSIMGI